MSQEWRAKNPEASRILSKEQQARWRSRNPEKNRAQAKAWRIAHPEMYQVQQEAWKEANPDYERRRSLKKYGMTPEDFDFMFEEQAGRCAICSYKAKFRNLCVDHDHKTGAVRGLLCDSCNMAIGKMKDDPVILRQAAEYLEKANGKVQAKAS